MKKWFMSVVLVTVLLSCSFAFAQEDEVTYGADLCFESKYMWNGLTISDHPVLQPDAWVSYKGFSFMLWGNMELTGWKSESQGKMSDGYEFNEIDFIGSYGNSWNKFNYEVGIMYYIYPNTHHSNRKLQGWDHGTDPTREAYLSLSYDWTVSPFLNVVYDFDEASGTYLKWGASYSQDIFEIQEKPVSMTLTAGMGWASENYASYNYGGRESGFTDWFVDLSTSYALTDNISLGGHIAYSDLMSGIDGVRSGNPENANINAGLSCSFAF